MTIRKAWRRCLVQKNIYYFEGAMWHHLGKVALDSAVSAAVSTTVKVGIEAVASKKRQDVQPRQSTPQQVHYHYSITDDSDAKWKLENMSTKDLLVGIRFFNDGFLRLCQVFGEGAINVNEGKIKSIASSKEKVAPGSSGHLTISPSTAWLDAIFLFKGLNELDDSALRALSDAKERFKDAARQATKAFCNEALSAGERVLALRCRVAASLLEKIDDPVDALGSCKLYLEELHAMRVVRESFKKRGGSQSIQADVRDLNSFLCDVTQLVGNVGGLLSWPCVVVAERRIDPLHHVEMMSKHYCSSRSFGQEGNDKHRLNFAWSIASNTRGDFIVPDGVDRNIKFFDSNGKFQFCLDPFENESRSAEYEDEVWNVATDQHDNIYVLTVQRDNGVAISSKVYMFDKDCRRIQKLDLREGFRGFSLAVDDSNRVFVMGGSFSNLDNTLVAVYNQWSGFVQSFGNKHLKKAQDITVADEGRVMVLNGETDPIVLVFSVDGKLLHNFKVTSSLPDSGIAMTFHKTSETVLVASLLPDNRVKVSMYQTDGHLVRVIQFKDKGGPFITGVTATAKGRIAVPGQNTVLFC